MSLGRALYHMLWRKKYVFLLLLIGCATATLVMQLSSKTPSKTDILKRHHYNLPLPKGVSYSAWWEKLPNGTHKTRMSVRHKLFYNPHKPPSLFTEWQASVETGCAGNLVAYAHEFVHFHYIVLDRKLLKGRQGGEQIKEVINQSEQVEYHECTYGCFLLACVARPEYFFKNENHLISWYEGLRTLKRLPRKVNKTCKKFTIMIVRYEYANIYHTLTDFYNTFLLMNFFNRTQHDTNILIVDGHPQGQLDPIWNTLFNSSVRISSLPRRTLFTNAVWGMLGYNSPILVHDLEEIPLIEEFREFFLSSYHMADSHQLDCQHLSVLFIWRHDYLAHPRNPEGVVSRKIANERELLNFTKTTYPHFSVRGVQIDQFEFMHQLQLVTDTDILIGMHGAGLTHTVFLPKHATLIELIPMYWAYNAHGHFEAFAKWRHLHYISWENEIDANEVEEKYTNIPTDVLHDLIEKAITQMCRTRPTPAEVAPKTSHLPHS